MLSTAHAIADVQRADGMIPWFEGGHCDPWNHVEAAMALSVCGLIAEAEAAYRWLADRQLPDGSWFNYYQGAGVKDQRLDTNVCAYLAAGAWHHHLITGDVEFLGELWPTIQRGIDFILRWQQPDGSVLWSLDPSGQPEGYALLTGSSSIYHSMRCAVAVAECLAKDRPDWELAAGRLGHAVAHHPTAFAPKVEFAMDWYYPMLSRGARGRGRAASPGRGVDDLRHGGPRRALRLDRRLGHRGRDGRVRPGPRRTGHGRPRPGPLRGRPEPATRRRLVLDGDGLSRGGHLSRERAHDVHLRRHGAGGRRTVEHVAGRRACSGASACPAALDLAEPHCRLAAGTAPPAEPAGTG